MTAEDVQKKMLKKIQLLVSKLSLQEPQVKALYAYEGNLYSKFQNDLAVYKMYLQYLLDKLSNDDSKGLRALSIIDSDTRNERDTPAVQPAVQPASESKNATTAVQPVQPVLPVQSTPATPSNVSDSCLQECRKFLKSGKNAGFQCRKCKKTTVKYAMKQVRSPDEPMTIFYTCKNPDCRFEWRE